MKARTHAITPTDAAPQPGPDWRYSRPRVIDHRTVEIDAMQITLTAQHQQHADARFKKKGWGKDGR